MAPPRRRRRSRGAGSAAYEVAKRTLDLALACVGLLGLVAIFPAVGLAILLDSPGPIFHRQTRVGRHGRLFRLWKFRTMRRDAERGTAVWARVNDERVTRVGRFLRACHLDELPQALNILRGEMSVIGPRPERPELLAGLVRRSPRHLDRLQVKPGLGGLGYVRQGYVSTAEEATERLRHDLDYIETRSLSRDLELLGMSLSRAIRFQGR